MEVPPKNRQPQAGAEQKMAPICCVLHNGDGFNEEYPGSHVNIKSLPEHGSPEGAALELHY